MGTFKECLKAIFEKKQGTVNRLTLVSGYNNTEIGAYGELIRLGNREFIEMKGVTFCDYSGDNPITMQHVPFIKKFSIFVPNFLIF